MTHTEDGPFYVRDTTQSAGVGIYDVIDKRTEEVVDRVVGEVQRARAMRDERNAAWREASGVPRTEDTPTSERVHDKDDDDVISFRIRNARLIAAFFLDFLDSDADSFFPHKVRLCRYDQGREEWRPVAIDAGALIADFVEWCRQE